MTYKRNFVKVNLTEYKMNYRIKRLFPKSCLEEDSSGDLKEKTLQKNDEKKLVLMNCEGEC